MILQKTPEFFEEITKYSLVCSCENCIHFNGQTNKCSLGWPNSQHKKSEIKSTKNKELLFCKEFDLK